MVETKRNFNLVSAHDPERVFFFFFTIKLPFHDSCQNSFPKRNLCFFLGFRPGREGVESRSFLCQKIDKRKKKILKKRRRKKKLRRPMNSRLLRNISIKISQHKCQRKKVGLKQSQSAEKEKEFLFLN